MLVKGKDVECLNAISCFMYLGRNGLVVMDVQSGLVLTATITVEIHLCTIKIDYKMLQSY